MTQLTLGMVRNTDPDTSKRAAAVHVESGRRVTNASVILDHVRSSAGLTAAELGQRTDLGQHECNRRLSELRRIGLVEMRLPRTCSVKHTQCGTWWPG